MKNKLSWLIIVGLLILLLGSVFGVMVFGVRNRVNTKVDGYRFEILNEPIEAELKSKNNYLNIIMLRMKNPGIENDGVFKFELFDEKGNRAREIKFGGMNIGDPGDMRFQFDPIPDSKDKLYKIVITPDEALPIVSIEVSSESELSYTSYFRTINKSLAVRSFVSLLKDKFIVNFGFFSLWFLILLGIVVYDLRKD